MERQRDVGHKTVRLVLQLAQANQVIHAVLRVLDMPVQHGAVGAQPQLVRRARRFNPLVAVDLVVADDAPHPLVEDLRPAARQRIHAAVAQPFERLSDRKLAAPRQVRDLHHGEGLQVYLREPLLQAAQHFAEPVQGQLGMQAADNVKLRDRLAPAFPRLLPHLFERHGIGLGIPHPLAERAQPATGHAHVRRVDVPVHVEVSGVPVQPLANQVGQVSQRQNVAAAVERQAIVEREPLARLDLAANGNQARIVNYDLHIHTPGLLRKISAAQNKKNNTLTYPFIVKKAALTRERSCGFTRLCSYTSSARMAATPARASHPKWSERISATRDSTIAMCSSLAKRSAPGIPKTRGTLQSPSAVSNS